MDDGFERGPDGLIYAALTAGSFAWLWPEIAVA